MEKEAEKLEQVIEKMQKIAPDLASIPAPFGLKSKHKFFWEELFKQLQESTINIIGAIENKSGKNIEFAFDDENFKKAWSDWQFFNYEESGKFISETKASKQMLILKNNCKDSIEAIDTINYLINRNYTYIFKVNFEKNSENANPDNDF
jgi:hypothetical protein